MTHLDDGQMHGYLDGELDESVERSFDAHLAGCAACTARFETAVRERALASELIAALGSEAIAASGWEQLVARAAVGDGLSGAARRARPATRWFPGLAWAATLLLAFTLGWQAKRSWTPGPTAADAATGAAPRRAPARVAETELPSAPESVSPVELSKRLIAADMPDDAVSAAELAESAEVPPQAVARRQPVPVAVPAQPPALTPAQRAEKVPVEKPAQQEREVAAEQRAEALAKRPAEAPAQRSTKAPPQAGEWEVVDERELRAGSPPSEPTRDERPSVATESPGIEPWVRIDVEEAADWLGLEPARLGERVPRLAEVTVGPVLIDLQSVVLRLTYELDGRQVTMIEQTTRVVVDRSFPRRSPIDGMPFVQTPESPEPSVIRVPPSSAYRADYSVLEDGRGALRFLRSGTPGTELVIEVRADLPEADLRAIMLEIR